MKHSLVTLFVLAIVLIITILVNQTSTLQEALQEGDISFVSYNAIGQDSFAIKINRTIKPNTIINFTDSEWDGTKFSKDETNVIWKTGNTSIVPGTIVSFGKKEGKPYASIGKVNKAIKISKSGDAIFAYIGFKRQPLRFLSAMANHKDSYGTLKNTGLKEGVNAITFIENPQENKKETSDLISLKE
jgi:hypothetical protein